MRLLLASVVVRPLQLVISSRAQVSRRQWSACLSCMEEFQETRRRSIPLVCSISNLSALDSGRIYGAVVLTLLSFVKLWRSGMIDTGLLWVSEDLSTAFVHALLSHDRSRGPLLAARKRI